ncbi:MAG: hypothetical protein ACRENO_07270 [Thermodesulfobacteriota bacterium]
MNDAKILPDKQNINLSFYLEPSATLWNRIFEGFESEVTLVSRFEGKDRKSIEILYRFGSIVRKRYINCRVEPKSYGIIIIRKIDEEQKEFINEWINLMKNLKSEILSCI